jgi:uncharacterized membrane protein YdbT with pleckstrin-like domain
MKKYTDQTLTKGEKVIENVGPSRWMFYTAIANAVGGVAMLIGPVLFTASMVWAVSLPVLGLFFIYASVSGAIIYYTTEFALTNKKVLAKSGLISRSTDELQLKKIEGVDVKQGILERILGYGSVILSGTGSQKVEFYGVDNPLEIKKLIDSKI